MRVTSCLLAALALGCGALGDDGEGERGPVEPLSTERGGPIAAAVKATVGPAGGSLVSADGRLTLEVPAGAVANESELSLEPISNLAPGGVGNGYRIGPEGLELAAPVTLSFKAPEAGESRAGIGALGIATQDAEGFWVWQQGATRDEATKSVSLQVTHFSDWSLVEGVQLRPLYADVALGASLALEVAVCYPQPREDGLAWLGYNCAGGLAPLGSASDWAVQGVAGGNGTFGTVSAQDSGARYTAPGQRPNPSTVAVSARWDASTILVAHLNVGAPASYHGTIEIESQQLAGPSFTAGGTLLLQPARFDDGTFDEGPDQTAYDTSGSITLDVPISLGEATCTTGAPTVSFAEERSILYKEPPWSIGISFLVNWTLTCTTPDGASFEWPLYFTWFQGCPTVSGLIETRVPVTDPRQPSGSFTRFCNTDTTTASWTLAQ